MSWRDSTLGTGAVLALPASTAPANNAPSGRGSLFSRHSSFKGSASYHPGATDAVPTASTSYELGGIGAAAAGAATPPPRALPSASIGSPLTSLQGAPPLQQLSSPQISAPPPGRHFSRTPSMDRSSSRKGSTLSWLAGPSLAPASTPSPAAEGPQSTPTTTRPSSSPAPSVAPQPLSNGRPATSPGPSTATGYITFPAKSGSLDTPFASTLASPPGHMREMRSYEASTASPAAVAASGAAGVAATTSGYFPTAPSAAAAAASLAVRAASERRIQRLLHKIDSVCSSHSNVSGPESGSNSLPSNAFLERSDRDRDRDRDRESPASAPLFLTQELQSLLAATLPALPEGAAAGGVLSGVSGDGKERLCPTSQPGSFLAGTEEEGGRRATGGKSRRRSSGEARLSPTASRLAAAASAGDAGTPPAAASAPEALGPQAADAGAAGVGRTVDGEEGEEPCVGRPSVDADAGYAGGLIQPDMEVAVELTLRPRQGAGHGAGPGPGQATSGPPATGRAAGVDVARGRRTAPGVVLLGDALVARTGSSGSSGSEPRLAWPPAAAAAAGHDAATGRLLLRSGSHDSSSLSDAVDREPSARQLVHASAADRGSRGSMTRMATSASGALLTLAPAAAAALAAAVDWASKPEPELERRSKGAGVGGRRRSLGREAYGSFRSRRNVRNTSGSSSDGEAGGGGGGDRADAAGDGWLAPRVFLPADVRFSDGSDDDDTGASDSAEAGDPAGRHHRYARNQHLEADEHPTAAHATAHSARTLHPTPPACPPRQSAVASPADAAGSSASLASVGGVATAAAALPAAAPTAGPPVVAVAPRRTFPPSPLQSRLAQAPPAARIERPSANLEQAVAAPGPAPARRSQPAFGGGGGGGANALSTSDSEGKAYGGGGLAAAASPPLLSMESARPSPGQQLAGVPAFSTTHYGEALRQPAARDLSPPPRSSQLSPSSSSSSLAAVDEGAHAAGGDEGCGLSGAMATVQPAPPVLLAWGGRGGTAAHPPAEPGPPPPPLQPAVSAALGIMAYSADLSARIDAVLQYPLATPGAPSVASAQPSRLSAPAALAGGPSSASNALKNAATLVALIDEDLGRSSAVAAAGGLQRGSSGLHAVPPHPHSPSVPHHSHHSHHVPHGPYTLPYGSSAPQAARGGVAPAHGVANAPLPHAPTVTPAPPTPTATAGTATGTAAVDPALQAQAHMRNQLRALGGRSQRRLRAHALGVADSTWAGRTVTPPESDPPSYKSMPGEVPRSGGDGGGTARATVDSGSSSGGGAWPGRPYDTDLGRRLSMQDHRQSPSSSSRRYLDRRHRLTGEPSGSGSDSDGSSDDFIMRLGAREAMEAAGARRGFTPPPQVHGGDGLEAAPHDGLGLAPPHGQVSYMPGGSSAVHTVGGAAGAQPPGAASRGAHTEAVRPRLQYRQRSFGTSGAFGSIMRRLDEQLAEAAPATAPLPVASLSSTARVAEVSLAAEAEPSRLRSVSSKYNAVGGGSPIGNAGGGGGGGATYGTAVTPPSAGAAGVMQPLGRPTTAPPLGGPQQLPGSRTFPPPATTTLPSTASSRILLGGGAGAAVSMYPPEGEPYDSGRTTAAAPKSAAAHVVVEEGTTLNIDVLKRDLERLLAR